MWLEGHFELICSTALPAELERSLADPKPKKHIDAYEARAILSMLELGYVMVPNPEQPPTVKSVDPDDDYLIALAELTRSVLVSGDRDLLPLANQIPVYTPKDFLDLLSA